MPEHESRLEQWNADQFNRAIFDSIDRKKLGVVEYAKLPGYIELTADIQDAAERCHAATERHPNRHEFAANIYTDPLSSTIITEPEVEGNEEHIVARQPYGISNAINRQLEARSPQLIKPIEDFLAYVNADRDRMMLTYEDSPMATQLRKVLMRPIGLVHSHPAPATFSHQDIASFISRKEVRLWVVTEPDKTVNAVVSTRETRWQTKVEAAKRVQEWQHMLSGARAQTGIIKGDFNYDWLRAGLYERMVPALAKDYKFGYYKGKSGSKLKRVA